MGRPPSPPGTRQRRNAGQGQWQEIAPPPSRIPDWPGSVKTDPPEARKYWRTVHKELGGMFSEADKMPLYRAAMLHAQVLASGRKRGMSSRLVKIAQRFDEEDPDREFLVEMALDFGFALADGPAVKALFDLEDKLGISPTSRRRLQWELRKGTGKAPDDAAPATDRSRAARQTSTGNTLSALTG